MLLFDYSNFEKRNFWRCDSSSEIVAGVLAPLVMNDWNTNDPGERLLELVRKGVYSVKYFAISSDMDRACYRLYFGRILL